MAETDKYGIPLPPDGEEPWGALYRQGMQLIDEALGIEHNADGTHSGVIVLELDDMPSEVKSAIELLDSFIPRAGTPVGEEIVGDLIFDSSDIIPLVDATCNVGAATKRWKNIYAENMFVDNYPNMTFTADIGDPTIVEGDVVTVQSGDLYKAQSNSISTLPAIGIVTSIDAGVGVVCVGGYCQFSTSIIPSTIGIVYVSHSTPGALTLTPPPRGYDYFHQIFGLALSSTELLVINNLQVREV